MCIEFPGRVLEVDATGATVLRGGRPVRASTFLVSDVAPGDWVFVAAGTIIRRLEPEEAAQVISTLGEAISRASTPAAAGIGGSR